MKTAVEFLREKYDITPETKNHTYEYLYKSMVVAMNEFAVLQHESSSEPNAATPEITLSDIKQIIHEYHCTDPTKTTVQAAWGIHKLLQQRQAVGVSIQDIRTILQNEFNQPVNMTDLAWSIHLDKNAKTIFKLFN